MFGTFNMGIGFVLIVDKGSAEAALKFLNGAGEKAYRIGTVKKGKPEVVVEF
jgi:phosphoribosylformylglycinamidine cyclo-ligase